MHVGVGSPACNDDISLSGTSMDVAKKEAARLQSRDEGRPCHRATVITHHPGFRVLPGRAQEFDCRLTSWHLKHTCGGKMQGQQRDV